MQKQYCETQSLVKTKAVNEILWMVSDNASIQLSAVFKFLNKVAPKATAKELSLPSLLTIIPEANHTELHKLYDMYSVSDNEKNKARWYVVRLLTDAMDMAVAKRCLPEHYWKYITSSMFNGDKTDLFNQECYDILEQAPMNRMLLSGTNG